MGALKYALELTTSRLLQSNIETLSATAGDPKASQRLLELKRPLNVNKFDVPSTHLGHHHV